jgi:AraC-like DNA-binding protein
VPSDLLTTTLPVLNVSGSTMGLRALRDELLEEGVSTTELIAGSGMTESWFDRPDIPPSRAQRVTIMRNAWRLARRSDAALRAGCRQTISDFGLYGYGMASSETVSDCLQFGYSQIEFAGPVLNITREIRGDTGVFLSQNPLALGPILPFAAEFWRSSMTTLLDLIMGQRFPSTAMFFPYPEPPHADALRETFGCELHFDATLMEWHFDAACLSLPCPNASRFLATLCTDFCESVLTAGQGQTRLQREIRLILLGKIREQPVASEIASELGLSRRSLYRRLFEEKATFQGLLDDVRASVAIQFLSSTRLPVEEIAHRVGFADQSNFRKAFKRWTGATPSSYRSRVGGESLVFEK